MSWLRASPLSVAVMGDVGCGKSTLLRHLVPGEVGRATSASGAGRSWELVNRFACIAGRRVTFFEVPGDPKYSLNAVPVLGMVDACVLVVSAAEGEWERGYGRYGSTRSMPLAAFTMGAKRILIAVNKLTFEPSNLTKELARYTEIRGELTAYLHKVGFNPPTKDFIPVNGLTGENIASSTEGDQWYQGRSLIAALGSLPIPSRVPSSQLQSFPPVIQILRVLYNRSIIIGKVLYGTVSNGMTLWVEPQKFSITLRSIELCGNQVDNAEPGDIAGLRIDCDTRRRPKRGSIAIGGSSSTESQIRRVDKFSANMIVLRDANCINVGAVPVLFTHSASVPCKLDSIVQKIDKATGRDFEDPLTTLRRGDCAIVTLIPCLPLAVGSFSQFSQFGRFLCSFNGTVCAVGVIKEVTPHVTRWPKWPVIRPILAAWCCNGPTCPLSKHHLPLHILQTIIEFSWSCNLPWLVLI